MGLMLILTSAILHGAPARVNATGAPEAEYASSPGLSKSEEATEQVEEVSE